MNEFPNSPIPPEQPDEVTLPVNEESVQEVAALTEEQPAPAFTASPAEQTVAPAEQPLFSCDDALSQGGAAPAAAVPAGGVSLGAKILLVLMFLAIVGFCVFCIVWDLQKGSQSGGYLAGDVINVHIGYLLGNFLLL